MSTTTARNPGIDLLRGLSILLVILNHLGIRIRLLKTALAGVLPGLLLTDLTFNGSEAVFIFFVISGFLITNNSIERWGRLGAIDARAFYVRRASRILPCLIALVAILSLFHALRLPDYVITRPGQSLHGAVASAFGLYLNWYEAHTGYLPANWDVLWSLSIEEMFYLGFPVACLAGRRDWQLCLPLGVLVLSQPFALAAIAHNPIWLEKAYLPGMAGIAAGVLTAIASAHIHQGSRWAQSRWPRILLEVTGGTGVIAILGFEDHFARFIRFGVILVLTVSTAALVLGFHLHARAVPGWRLKGTGWLQSGGRLSYEIYLTHMFVVLSIVRLFHMSHASPRWGFAWYVPAILFAWALGWLASKYFSFPAERALRRRLLNTKQAPRMNPAIEAQELQ